MGRLGGPAKKVVSRLLPDAATRRARAIDMGFDPDDVLYHGTTKDVDAFNPAMANYLTSSPDVASDYASYMRSQIGSNVMPVHAKGKMLDVDADYNDIRIAERKAGSDYAGITDDDYPTGTEIYDWARQNGYDGIKFSNVTDDVPGAPQQQKPSVVTAVFDPSNIRSTNAAFDPEKEHSSRLLDNWLIPGAATGTAVGTGTLATPKKAYALDTANPGQLDVGSIQGASSPWAGTAANMLDRVDLPIMGKPFGGTVDWLRKVQYGDDIRMRDRAMAALDWL